MATLNDITIIQTMLKRDGKYPGDPQATSIWEYKNSMTTQRCFAVFWDERHNDIRYAPNVLDPVMLWDRQIGITMEGKKVLNERAS